MSEFDRALPPADRQEKPEPLPRETALERVKRICRERGWYLAEDEREPGAEG